MLKQPGGKQVVRYVLNSLVAIPVVGGAISAAGDIWGEKDQQKFNKAIMEWVSMTDIDLKIILEALNLKKVTKVNFFLFLQETLQIDLPANYPAGGYEISVILNNETVNEFKQYERKGWISMKSNGNMSSMGVGNRIGNSIEDKKRPWGMGNGFVITVNRSLFGQ